MWKTCLKCGGAMKGKSLRTGGCVCVACRAAHDAKYGVPRTRRLKRVTKEEASVAGDRRNAMFEATSERRRLKKISRAEVNLVSCGVKSPNRRERLSEMRGKGMGLSETLAETLLVKQHGLCACCGLPLENNYHLDHIMPIALGGANEDWNIQLLRARCNLQKSDRHPVEFMRSRGHLDYTPPAKPKIICWPQYSGG